MFGLVETSIKKAKSRIYRTPAQSRLEILQAALRKERMKLDEILRTGMHNEIINHNVLKDEKKLKCSAQNRLIKLQKRLKDQQFQSISTVKKIKDSKNRDVRRYKLEDICFAGTISAVDGKELICEKNSKVDVISKNSCIMNENTKAVAETHPIELSLAANKSKKLDRVIFDSSTQTTMTKSVFNSSDFNNDVGNKLSRKLIDSILPSSLNKTTTSKDLILSNHVGVKQVNENEGIFADYYDIISYNLTRIFAESNKTIEIEWDGCYFVADTNILLRNLTFLDELLHLKIQGIKEPVLLIPYEVLVELDKLKQRCHESVSTLAIRAIKYLNAKFEEKCSLIKGNVMQTIYCQ